MAIGISRWRDLEASEHIASPICRSIALCIEAERPVLFDTFCDDADYPMNDIRPEKPIRFLATRAVRAGEVVRSLEYDRWSAMRGRVDASFLKLETGTERPVTIAFSRETLRPISIGVSPITAHRQPLSRDRFTSASRGRHPRDMSGQKPNPRRSLGSRLPGTRIC